MPEGRISFRFRTDQELDLCQGNNLGVWFRNLENNPSLVLKYQKLSTFSKAEVHLQDFVMMTKMTLMPVRRGKRAQEEWVILTVSEARAPLLLLQTLCCFALLWGTDVAYCLYCFSLLYRFALLCCFDLLCCFALITFFDVLLCSPALLCCVFCSAVLLCSAALLCLAFLCYAALLWCFAMMLLCCVLLWFCIFSAATLPQSPYMWAAQRCTSAFAEGKQLCWTDSSLLFSVKLQYSIFLC